MQTIVSQLETAFRAAINAAFGIDADPLLTVAQNEKFGDYQSNAAMGLAKTLAEKTGQKTNPRAVAEQIKARLQLAGMAENDGISIAGPGFINIRLAPEWLALQLRDIATDERLGIEPTKNPQNVVVDYSGPNIAKQMHVGHLRSTIIGDAAARTLQFVGHNVIRQNHLGDWGTQFGRVVLAMWYESVFTKTGNPSILHHLIERQQTAARAFAENENKAAFETAIAGIVEDLLPWHQRLIEEDPDGLRYFKPYLESATIDLDELERSYVFVSVITDAPKAAQVTIAHGLHGRRTLEEIPRLTTTFIQRLAGVQNDQEELAWKKARDITLTACAEIYRRLNIQLADQSVQKEPLERGESFYNPFLADVVKSLREKGIAIESKGATVIEVPGFEAPLIIEKGTGGYLYGTTDLAAIRFRVSDLHANRILYFVDARQSQHFAQAFWAAKQASYAGGASLEHAAFGTMLGPDGKPFKTRSGDTVKLKDLLDEAEQRALDLVKLKNSERPFENQLPEARLGPIAHSVGIGAVKYSDLSKDRTSDYMFSWDKMLSFDGNTAPYLQYAYARIASIFRKAGGSGAVASNLVPQLQSPYEQSLAKHALRFQEIIDLVARELKPHYLCTYLYELAGKFSSFYENCEVLKSEEPTRSSRLLLIDITRRTLAKGLDLLGIEHPEQM